MHKTDNTKLVSSIKEISTIKEAKQVLKFLLEQADFSNSTPEFKSQCFSIVFTIIDSLK